MIYNITPVPKPRMTRADKWKKRKCVQRYWDFKDKVRESGLTIPECGSHVTFLIPMPASWSKKKRKELAGTRHQSRPDVDNLMKGLMDAIFDEDAHIWNTEITKVWGEAGAIVVELKAT